MIKINQIISKLVGLITLTLLSGTALCPAGTWVVDASPTSAVISGDMQDETESAELSHHGDSGKLTWGDYVSCGGSGSASGNHFYWAGGVFAQTWVYGSGNWITGAIAEGAGAIASGEAYVDGVSATFIPDEEEEAGEYAQVNLEVLVWASVDASAGAGIMVPPAFDIISATVGAGSSFGFNPGISGAPGAAASVASAGTNGVGPSMTISTNGVSPDSQYSYPWNDPDYAGSGGSAGMHFTIEYSDSYVVPSSGGYVEGLSPSMAASAYSIADFHTTGGDWETTPIWAEAQGSVNGNVSFSIVDY